MLMKVQTEHIEFENIFICNNRRLNRRVCTEEFLDTQTTTKSTPPVSAIIDTSSICNNRGTEGVPEDRSLRMQVVGEAFFGARALRRKLLQRPPSR